MGANRTPVVTTTTANTSTVVATKRMTPTAAMMAGIETIRIAVADVTKNLADATQPKIGHCRVPAVISFAPSAVRRLAASCMDGRKLLSLIVQALLQQADFAMPRA